MSSSILSGAGSGSSHVEDLRSQSDNQGGYPSKNPYYQIGKRQSRPTVFQEIEKGRLELARAFALVGKDVGDGRRLIEALRTITDPTFITALTSFVSAGSVRYWDAVVGPSAGSGIDYISISAALSGGARRIFVKNGIYTEGAIGTLPSGTVIVGEDISSTIITGTITLGSNTEVRNLTFGNGGTDQASITISGNYCRFEDIILNSNSSASTSKILVSGNFNYLRNIQEVAGTDTVITLLVTGNDNYFEDIHSRAANSANGNSAFSINGNRNTLRNFSTSKGTYSMTISGDDHTIERGAWVIIDNCSSVTVQSNTKRLRFSDHYFSGMLATTGVTRAIRIDGNASNLLFEHLDFTGVSTSGSSYAMHCIQFEPGTFTRSNIEFRHINANSGGFPCFHNFVYFNETAASGSINNLKMSHIRAWTSDNFILHPSTCNASLTDCHFSDLTLNTQYAFQIKGGVVGNHHSRLNFNNIYQTSPSSGGRFLDILIPTNCGATYFSFSGITLGANTQYFLYARGSDAYYAYWNASNINLASNNGIKIDVEVGSGSFFIHFAMSNVATVGEFAELETIGTGNIENVIFSSFTATGNLSNPYATLISAATGRVVGIIFNGLSFNIIGGPVTLFTSSGAGTLAGHLHAINYKATAGITLSAGAWTTPNNNDTYPT